MTASGPAPAGRAAEIVARLGMQPHSERGFFVETYRSSATVTAPANGAQRAASTAIYFLVTREQPTTYLHRLLSDELFHLYEGGPLDVLSLREPAPGGVRAGQVARLGLDLAAGERPQLVIPAGTWFAVELAPSASHCLFGCTVAPGFDFADFDLAAGPELAVRFPEHAARIARMTRPE
jgi:predicted cupin superfamily sugar epimerase